MQDVEEDEHEEEEEEELGEELEAEEEDEVEVKEESQGPRSYDAEKIADNLTSDSGISPSTEGLMHSLLCSYVCGNFSRLMKQ